ncbi:N-acetyltransferase [Mesorhizobium sp. M1C.F.Ca.ET.193.01.1.1]|uniref:GNAT family N-acetyltransferase n=1 Tax=unclassified Mesorhizobium TaxID=325217 RepID=UPI000FD28C30|nr:MULTISPECIES: N-acetyltransferase [unclassified Mesorhizobium]TGS93983.1 N-acetyltransferase [bacterium M00.F.Ca.ET.177.01.1.1]TGQ51051.1 N-acetyltransferase [Mesorhizobium sp. M1C.F.Ca.ET.210.01.1.1]TGQ66482.1 N-acetyltransferase [Mesorhizobium sp. M1C.F.Ca.ET.212.01.1.1]TGR00878.1 N-acetyltransferase [Mesorhizobium sp. M1C.F.Ca.ET.204.01.1.1]TGR21153.1 N-acetyltransferase [Mesorhizobium sp. M1C.F.Ca.ET.196.01.1.1]
MSLADVKYLPEAPAHDAEIEAINDEAFGPGRFVLAAYKIRESGGHDRSMSFVAVEGDTVIASVRMTRVAAGAGRAMMLGPLAVRPAFKNLGIGRRLVAIALEAAAKAGAPAVMLVGDEPYYGPLGFKRFPRGQITMPRPVDLDRLLHHEIRPGAVARFVGEVCHADMAKVAELAPAAVRAPVNQQVSIDPVIQVAPQQRAS